jgi:hypothetical protein
MFRIQDCNATVWDVMRDRSEYCIQYVILKGNDRQNVNKLHAQRIDYTKYTWSLST